MFLHQDISKIELLVLMKTCYATEKLPEEIYGSVIFETSSKIKDIDKIVFIKNTTNKNDEVIYDMQWDFDSTSLLYESYNTIAMKLCGMLDTTFLISVILDQEIINQATLITKGLTIM